MERQENGTQKFSGFLVVFSKHIKVNSKQLDIEY